MGTQPIWPVALAGAGVGWWVIRRMFDGRPVAWNGRGSASYPRATAYGDDFDDARTTDGWGTLLRDHPVPAMLAAASIWYLLMQRSHPAYLSGPDDGRAYVSNP